MAIGWRGLMRNIEIGTRYGLRKKQRDHGPADRRPLGPRLIRGRGVRRRPGLSAGYTTALLLLLAVVGAILIRLLRLAA